MIYFQVAKANGDTLQVKVLSTDLRTSDSGILEPEQGPSLSGPIETSVTSPKEPESMEMRPKGMEEISEPLELREICPDPNMAIAMPDKEAEEVTTYSTVTIVNLFISVF